MRRFILPYTALLAIAVCSAADAAAQASKTSGFLLGARVNATAIEPEDDPAERGVGLGVLVGYGFTPAITVYLNADGAALRIEGEDYTLGFGDLGLRYTFGGDAAALRPYANAALTGTVIQTDFEGESVELRGGGLTAGGGINYFFSRTVALDGTMQFTFGRFTEGRSGGVTVPLEDDAFSFQGIRLQVGINARL